MTGVALLYRFCLLVSAVACVDMAREVGGNVV